MKENEAHIDQVIFVLLRFILITFIPYCLTSLHYYSK